MHGFLGATNPVPERLVWGGPFCPVLNIVETQILVECSEKKVGTKLAQRGFDFSQQKIVRIRTGRGTQRKALKDQTQAGSSAANGVCHLALGKFFAAQRACVPCAMQEFKNRC